MTSNDVKQCKVCHQSIYDRYIIAVGDDSYHNDCLTCFRCSASLSSNEACYDKKGGLYCTVCYFRVFSRVRCKGCLQGIANSEFVMKTHENYYHVNCFCCSYCKIQLKCGQRYGVKGGDLFCEGHYYSQSVKPEVIDSVNIQSPAIIRNHIYEDINCMPALNPAPSQIPPLISTPIGIQQNSIENNIYGMNGHLFHDPYKMNYDISNQYSYSPSTSDDDSTFKGKQKKRRMSKEKRFRTTFTTGQVAAMKDAFNIERNPDSSSLQSLSEKVNLSKRVLQVWFQNARAKYKKGIDGESDGIESVYLPELEKVPSPSPSKSPDNGDQAEAEEVEEKN